MGSSAKKKKEKKKDFQKQKLKVGKTKPKAANFTDTSFTAKSISLKQQFANHASSAPSSAAQIAHHVSRLRNRTDSLRLESLAYLTNLPDAELHAHAQDIIPKLPGLIHDLSPAVRTQLLKLLRRFSKPRIELHAELLLTWTRAGITHLSQDIRLFALDVLEWLLSAAAAEVVSCKGGWVVTLRSFLSTLGWTQATDTHGWSSYHTIGARLGGEAKARAKLIQALAAFIEAGIALPDPAAVAAAKANATSTFPLLNLPQHLLPNQRHNAFAHLNLFGQVKDDRNVMLEDRQDRQESFEQNFLHSVNRGIEEAKKQAGEVGRAAALLQKAVDSGMR